MAEAFIVRRGGSGGGASLNFKVVGGTSAPSNPSENTIWVNTSTAISDWVFSATQPTGATGRVWIQIGTASAVTFNALKKNNITVYPVLAKQYIDGEWVTKVAKSYQNGEWTQFSVINLYLYNNGDQCTAVTGGWIKTNNCTITQETDHMKVYAGTDKAGSAATKNKINLDKYKTLVFKGYCSKNNTKSILYVADTSQSSFNYINKNVASIQIPQGTASVEVRLDISGITGSYNVGCGASESTVYCYEMYLE